MITFVHENDGETWTVEVEYHVVPHKPAVWYLSNGDPGYPAEGGYIEDLKFHVIGYTKYDDDGNVVEEFVSIPKDRRKEFDKRFEKLVDDRMHERIETLALA